MASNREIVGVLTNFGQIIPVKRGKYDAVKYPLIDMNFYPDADKYISKSVELINREREWSKSRNDEYENIFIIKKELGKKISSDENIKNQITTIVKNEKITKFKKIELLNKIFKGLLSLKSNEVELSDIANEVINDNVENLLINNVVMEHSYNKNEVKSRDTESIWLNINDITNWFKKYESDEMN